MAKININYSPYRNDFRAEKISSDRLKTALNINEEVIKIDISPTFLIIILFITALMLSVLYLLNFNRIATKGYQLKRLEISQQELKSQGDAQTLYLAKAKAMNGLLEDSRLEGMHKPNQVEFINGENVLARAN